MTARTAAQCLECVVFAAFLITALPLPIRADGPTDDQQQVTSQNVHVSAKREDGYVIGHVSKGTVVTLQYLSGKWKAWGRVATESPDDPKERGDTDSLVIAEHASSSKPSVLIAVVPSHTADRPFQWLADHDFKRVILRINSADANWASHPDANVMYSIKITLPAIGSAGGLQTSPIASNGQASNTPSGQNAPTTAPAELLVTTVSPAEIADYRQKKLQSADTRIKGLQSLIAMSSTLPDSSGVDLEKKLDEAKSSRDSIAAESDDAITKEILDARAAAAAQVQATQIAAAAQAQADQNATEEQRAAAKEAAFERQQEQAQAEADRTALLQRIWPNWNGPWKTCPYCGGTGTDVDAERAANTAKESAMASQMVGGGQFRTVKGTIIPCPLCHGTKVVPDN